MPAIRAAAWILLALCGASAQAVDLRPDAWGGVAAIGYDRRARNALGYGDPAAGTGDTRFWFAQPQDGQVFTSLWAQWKLRSIYRTTRVRLGAGRQEWLHGRILGRSLFELEVRQLLSPRSHVEIALEHAPQIYLQHRVDKNARPGEPRFRPEAYRETEATITFRHSPAPNLPVDVFAKYNVRDETLWFTERDRKRRGAGVTCEVPFVAGVRVVPLYEFDISRSRNRPDLGSDLSYREHRAQVRVRAGLAGPTGPWELELGTTWRFRDYTSQDPEDSHSGRFDRLYTWTAMLRRPLGQLTPFLSGETSGRWVNAPGDPATLDEDGEIDRSLIRVGVEWESD